MKELLTEEKAKAYDKALENIKKLVSCGLIYEDAAIQVFPELKEESEDERIRKEIINYFEHHPNIIVKRERKSDYIAWLERVGKQRSAWSEEDKEVINLLLELIYEQDKISPRIPSNEKRKIMLSWLKSLKGRVGCEVNCTTTRKWSEEDEKATNDIMWIIEAYRKNGFNETHIQIADSSENWLKSIKDRVQPQSQWKPSDEQIDALEDAIADAVSSIQKNMLNSLYQDLKKLKG